MYDLPRNRAKFCLNSSLLGPEGSPGVRCRAGVWAGVPSTPGEIRGAELLVIV